MGRPGRHFSSRYQIFRANSTCFSYQEVKYYNFQQLSFSSNYSFRKLPRKRNLFYRINFVFAANLKDVDIEEFNNVMSVSEGGMWL